MNRSSVLAERSPDLTQRLPLFPSLPEVSFLGRRQARTSHLSHHNHPPTPLYPRGCCIDRLNPPQPDSFSKTETGGFDDRYVLDPDAHRTWVKVATAIGHLGADFFTLCLWEFVGTPYEIAVRDKVVTYHLQYSPQGTLTSIEKIKG